jgi:hypothetical protein
LSQLKSLKKPSVALLCFKSHPQADSASRKPTAPADSATRKPTAKSYYRSQNKSTHKNALYLL